MHGKSELEQLCSAHRPGLLRAAWRLTRSQSEAEDLVQATFVRALEKLALYRRGTDFRSWLQTILQRLFIDECRRRKLWSRVALRLAHTPRLEREPEPWWQGLALEDLRAALGHLPGRLAVLMEDRYLRRLSYRGLATLHGIPRGTVGTRLRQGRHDLRQALAPR
jgi:RNA polymerase sigma-70 factor (ECF subfamily)